MDLAGPFVLASSGSVSTGLVIRPGDTVGVLASGFLGVRFASDAASRLVTPDGDPLPAPAAFPLPGANTSSLIARVDRWERGGPGAPVAVVGSALPLGSGFRHLPAGARGALSLDVNAPPSTAFAPATGWSVYVMRASAGETLPPPRGWILFRDLVGPVQLDSTIGAAVLDGEIHVFFVDGAAHALNHFAIAADGSIGPTTIVDRVLNVPSMVSALVHKGMVNAFYLGRGGGPTGELGVLRRAALTGSTFTIMDIDGSGPSSSTPGAISGVVGLHNSAAARGNELQVLYLASRDRNQPPEPGLSNPGLGGLISDLRQAWVDEPGPLVDKAPYVWHIETIDGAGGGGGRVIAAVGAGVSTVFDAAGQLHAFYILDSFDRGGGGGDLRHAEFRWVTTSRRSWRWESLDGAGRTFPDATGQTHHTVGAGTGCAFFDGELHVFYSDLTDGTLRWGARPPGGPWSFTALDGTVVGAFGGPLRYGTTPDAISFGPKSVVTLPDQLSVFYCDTGARRIRHAYKRRGWPWMFEIVDGDLALDGRIHSPLRSPTAVVRNGLVNVIYLDTIRNVLRLAVLGA